MNKNIRLAFGAFALLSLSLSSAAELRDSVVKIHVTQRKPDIARPWRKQSPSQVSGSGAVIAGRRIITNAHVVLYAQKIYVQAHQSTERIPAKLLHIAPEMDLAIITVDDEEFFKQHKALPLAKKLPALKDTINAYGYPIGGEQLSVTEGIVSRIEYAGYFYATGGLRIQVDAALNPGNSGGPAFLKEEIIGIVFSRVGSADNIGYLIPATEVNAFLEDVKDNKYDGKPKLADQLQTVENMALRKSLKLPGDIGGLMVKEPASKADDYPLKKRDVITHIGEHKLDKKGNVALGDLRISFRHWLTDATKDGKTSLKIYRDGKTVDVKVPVRNTVNRVLKNLNGEYPEHFILGPMSFTVATQDFIMAIGDRGRIALNLKGNPLVKRQFDKPKFDGEQIVILGARLFAHPIAEGYDPQVFGVVSHVNDEKVKNLAHLVKLVKNAKGEFITFNIAGSYELLVFRRQELIDSTEQILEDEGIRRQASSRLEKIWEDD